MRPSRSLLAVATRRFGSHFSYHDSLQGIRLIQNPLCQLLGTKHPLSPLSRHVKIARAVGNIGKSMPCLLKGDMQRERTLEWKTKYVRGFFSCTEENEDTGLSKQYKESRVVGYSPEQLYTVISAVDLYEDFVPWCQKSTVLWRKDDEAFDAELEVGFKFFVERYMSHVELKRPTFIKTSASQSSLFDYLINVWEFKPGPVQGTCDIHFFVDFQFRSSLYNRVANTFFDEVVSRLVGSFENRCNTVYGPGTKVLERTYGS